MHLPKAHLEAVEECVSELLQRPERLLGVDDERVARDDALALAAHHHANAVRRRLRPDADAGEVLLQDVADERRLACGRGGESWCIAL